MLRRCHTSRARLRYSSRNPIPDPELSLPSAANLPNQQCERLPASPIRIHSDSMRAQLLRAAVPGVRNEQDQSLKACAPDRNVFICNIDFEHIPVPILKEEYIRNNNNSNNTICKERRGGANVLAHHGIPLMSIDSTRMPPPIGTYSVRHFY